MNIEIADNDKININSSDTLFRIMRRILLREDTIDREKEHFWMIGLNMANIIVYIELVSLGSVRATIVEPMNVYRVAVLKGATSVIAVHNHPSGNMTASEADKDETDRLIQVGKILNIKLLDHLIISTDNFMSFANIGLMKELEQSIKYVPTYQIQERIRDRELELKKEKTKTDKLEVTAKKQQETIKTAVANLLKQNMTIEEIATILNLTPKEVELINKK